VCGALQPKTQRHVFFLLNSSGVRLRVRNLRLDVWTVRGIFVVHIVLLL